MPMVDFFRLAVCAAVLAIFASVAGLVTPSAAAQSADPGLYDCDAFASQEDAQGFFEVHGGPASDPYYLDGDDDGVACEPYFGLDDDEWSESPSRDIPAYDPPQAATDYAPSCRELEYEYGETNACGDEASIAGVPFVFWVAGGILVLLVLHSMRTESKSGSN
jgi:hypothetical protein